MLSGQQEVDLLAKLKIKVPAAIDCELVKNYLRNRARNSKDSDIAIDTEFTQAKIVLDGSSAELYINGVLEVTKSTNLPSTNLQPFFRAVTSTSSAKTGRIRYLEAYDT